MTASLSLREKGEKGKGEGEKTGGPTWSRERWKERRKEASTLSLPNLILRGREKGLLPRYAERKKEKNKT